MSFQGYKGFKFHNTNAKNELEHLKTRTSSLLTQCSANGDRTLSTGCVRLDIYTYIDDTATFK